MNAFVAYLRDSRDEILRVRWPTRALTIQYSVIVITSVVVFTTLFGLIDYGLTELFTKLLKLG